MANSVLCANCKNDLTELHRLNPESRDPCPQCGSTTRNFVLHAEAGHLTITGMEANLSVATSSNLLVQTVVVPGERTIEGQLIEAVALPWFEILRVLENSPTIAFQIPPRKWEEIIAGAYKKAGFDEVTLTPRSGDLGRDVIAIKKGLGLVRVIDQVKAYKPDHFVTADDVRALMGVLQNDGASKGFLTTTSDFAPKLREDPLIKPHIPLRLELINGTMLLKRLQELAKR